MTSWRYHEPYVRCADCEVLRPQAELAYRKFAAADAEGRSGEHHCADPALCAKLRAGLSPLGSAPGMPKPTAPQRKRPLRAARKQRARARRG